jgi:hypothetical protein
MLTRVLLTTAAVVSLVLVAATVATEEEGKKPRQEQRNEQSKMGFRAPNIVNVADIKSSPTGPTLLHLTQKQFERAQASLQRAAELPAGVSGVALIPLPGDVGGAIVFPSCWVEAGRGGMDCQAIVTNRDGNVSATCACMPREPSPAACGPVAFNSAGEILPCLPENCRTNTICTPKGVVGQVGRLRTLTVYCECQQ